MGEEKLGYLLSGVFLFFQPPPPLLGSSGILLLNGLVEGWRGVRGIMDLTFAGLV